MPGRMAAGVALAGVLVVVPGFHAPARAQTPSKQYVITVQYNTGGTPQSKEYYVRFTAQNIYFSWETLGRDKGVVIPRNGGTESMSDRDPDGDRREFKLSGRPGQNGVFFEAVAVWHITRMGPISISPYTAREEIAFLLTFSGAGCQVSQAGFVINEERQRNLQTKCD